MNPFRRIADFFRHKPGMIGTPPSQRAMWHDPAAHARDFAHRCAGDIDLAVAARMMELGIPNHQIGRPDPDHRGQWRAFFPRSQPCRVSWKTQSSPFVNVPTDSMIPARANSR
jgi:hypothetical protein